MVWLKSRIMGSSIVLRFAVKLSMLQRPRSHRVLCYLFRYIFLDLGDKATPLL